MSTNKPPPAEREVPRPVRYLQSGAIYRNLTLWERCKIMLGFNLLLEVHIATEHRPGNMKPLTKVHLTPQRDPQKALAKLQEDIRERQGKKGGT